MSQQSRVHQGHLACVLHVSTSFCSAPLGARVARPNWPTVLGRPIGNRRSVPHQPVVASSRRLLLAAGVRLLANARNFVLYLFNRCLCKGDNGMFFVSMLYAHSASAHSRSESALAMMAFLILLFLTLARACMHTMCLFTRADNDANEETIHTLGRFIPSASTRTEHRRLERWPYADACPRACPV